MLGVAAGVDHDQPLRRVEHDGVPVRPLVRRHLARNEMIGRRLGVARRCTAGKRQAQRNRTKSHILLP